MSSHRHTLLDTLTADELERRWAAKRLDVPLSTVKSVEFADEPETAYSTITVEPATRGATVQTSMGDHWIDLTDVEFGALLREILDA